MSSPAKNGPNGAPGSNGFAASRDDLLLLPTPHTVRLLGDWVEVGEGEAGVTEMLVFGGAIDPQSTAGQSYELRILRGAGDGARIELRAGSTAGLRLARCTLAQLRVRFGRRLPTLVIEDQPSFATRGVMLDVSRDRVPTMDELRRTVDLLAGLKFNHLQLYTEHTFAYAGHEEVWQGWSPLTPEEIRSLDVYCRERGVVLGANQNCFGHLASWLRRPRYAPLAETHGDWVFDGWPRSGPFSLCPVDPASLALVDDLLGQLLACFSSGLVNIGADETYDVGFGRSAEAVAARGRAAVYGEFVAKVCSLAFRRGFRPMFWADIALSHPETLRLLPEQLIALAWGYEPDAPFARWCSEVRHAGRNRQVWVCPGTSSWRSIYGRTQERRLNLRAAAVQGVAGGATGYLVCDWGDTGHHQQWPVMMHAIANGAQAAWNAGQAGAFDPRAASLHALGDESLRVGPWLEALGDADLALREVCLPLSRPGTPGRLRNQSALFNDLHNWRGAAGAEVGPMALWESARERVRILGEVLPRAQNSQLEDELRHTAQVAAFAADRAVQRRAPGGLSREQRTELRGRLEGLVSDHRRLWLLRSREGGLESSCRHYGAVGKDLEG